MGLRAYIHRSKIGPCANGGISDVVEEVTIVNAEGPFDPSPDAPAVEIRKGVFAGTVVAVPVDQPEGRVGPMFGGTYIATSDSRFTELVEKIAGQRIYGAIPLHDRFETPTEYEALSR